MTSTTPGTVPGGIKEQKMRYTNYSINAAGLAEIHAFLAAHHKKGGDHFDRDMLRAWAADAERKLSEGNSPTIEIKSWDSTSGHTEELTISDAGIDTEYIDRDD